MVTTKRAQMKRERRKALLLNSSLSMDSRIPVAEVQRLVDFDTFLKANPDTARRMAESIATPATGFPLFPKPPNRPVR